MAGLFTGLTSVMGSLMGAMGYFLSGSWFSAQAQTPPAREPSEHTLAEARTKVDQATASITTPTGKLATAVAFSHKGEEYLSTSAHLTSGNRRSHGFRLGGKEYYLVVKGNGVALAEHLAFNPQGAPCSKNNKFINNEAFADLSILRLLSKEETIALFSPPILEKQWVVPSLPNNFNEVFDSTKYDLAVNAPKPEDRAAYNTRMAELTKQLTALFNTAPTKEMLKKLQSYKADKHKSYFTREEKKAIDQGIVTPDIAVKLASNFSIEPLDILETGGGPAPRTPSAYSLGYFDNRARFARSTLTSDENGMRLKYSNDAIVPGHSGSLAFDVSEKGKLSLLGFVTGTDCRTQTAFLTPFRVLLEGIDAIRNNKLSATPWYLACDSLFYANGGDMWLTPSAATLPGGAPARAATSPAPSSCPYAKQKPATQAAK